MKLKFLLSVVALFFLQLASVNQIKAQAIDSTKVSQAVDSVKAKAPKPKKLEKLKELPDPLAVGWKKDKMFGDKLFAQGSLYNGLHYYEAAIAKNPKNATLLEHYGDILIELGDKSKAVEYWRKAKEAGSDSKTIDTKIASLKYVE